MTTDQSARDDAIVLPQAKSAGYFWLWIVQHLHFDHGVPQKECPRMASDGLRTYCKESGVRGFGDPAFDWSRPAAHEVCAEFILRDG